jgi:hypothetical protein
MPRMDRIPMWLELSDSSQIEAFVTRCGIIGPASLAYDSKNDFLRQHTRIKVVELIIQKFDEGNYQ